MTLPIRRGTEAEIDISRTVGIDVLPTDYIQQTLDDLAIVRGVELSKVIAVNDVDGAVLGAANHNVGVLHGPGAVGQQRKAARGYIEVAFIEYLLVVRSEVVSDRETRCSQLKERVAKIGDPIKCSVAG